MSGFSLEWLDLREAADHAARDAGLLAEAAAWLQAGSPPLAVDLGGGSGSTLRAFAPILAGPASWRIVDQDAALLAAAKARSDGGVETVQAGLDPAADLPLEDARLVTASALLDLVSEAWLGDLVAALRTGGLALYAALTYDGRMSWSRPHPLDQAILSAFNTHQRGDKGFGPALGPTATGVAVRLLEAAGYETRTADSPWRLGRADVAFERALVEGVADAASETGDLRPGEVEAWRRFRSGSAGNGGSVGHTDLLARPRL